MVNEGGGTGYSACELQNVDFSGKSGTAQLMSYEAGAKIGKKGKKPTAGSWATPRGAIRKLWSLPWCRTRTCMAARRPAPVVRDIVKAYYDKKNAHLQQQQARTPTTPATSHVHRRPHARHNGGHEPLPLLHAPARGHEETPHP